MENMIIGQRISRNNTILLGTTILLIVKLIGRSIIKIRIEHFGTHCAGM